MISPGVSANSYSPASFVASASSHEVGGACDAASLLHFISLGYGTLLRSIFIAIRNVLNDFIDLHRSVLASQLESSANLVAVLYAPEDNAQN